MRTSFRMPLILLACALTPACATSGANEGSGQQTTTSGPAPLFVAGQAHFCLYREASALRCWGRNLEGQLGNATTVSQQEPHLVVGLPRGYQLVHLAAGSRRTCATLSDGNVWCWGAGTPTPSQVRGLSKVRSVALDDELMCARTVKGLVCRTWEPEYGKPHVWESLLDPPVRGLTVAGGAICADTGEAQLSCWSKAGDYDDVGYAETRLPRVHAPVLKSGCSLSGDAVVCRRGASRSGPLEPTGLTGMVAVAAWRDEARCAVPASPQAPLWCDSDGDGRFETRVAWVGRARAQARARKTLKGLERMYRTRTETLLRAAEWRWRHKKKGYDDGLGMLYLFANDFEKAWQRLGAYDLLKSARGASCPLGFRAAERAVKLREPVAEVLLEFLSECIVNAKQPPPRSAAALVAAVPAESSVHFLRKLLPVHAALGLPSAKDVSARMLASARAEKTPGNRVFKLLLAAEGLVEAKDSGGATAVIREVWAGGKFAKMHFEDMSAKESERFKRSVGAKMAGWVESTDPALAGEIRTKLLKQKQKSAYAAVAKQAGLALERLKRGDRDGAIKATDQAQRLFAKLDRAKRAETGERSDARGALVRANVALKRWAQTLPYLSVFGLGDVVMAARKDAAGRKWLQGLDPKLLKLAPRTLRKKQRTESCQADFSAATRRQGKATEYVARCRDFLTKIRVRRADDEYGDAPVGAAILLAGAGHFAAALKPGTGAHWRVKDAILYRVTSQWLRAGRPEVAGLPDALAPYISRPPGVDSVGE